MKIGLISGTSINRSKLFEDWTTEEVATEYGAVSVKRRGSLVGMNRHGFSAALPPHAINYRANVAALGALGVESAITLNSVGSLRVELPPSSIVSCSDYMSFAPKTFIDDRMSAFAPEIANPLLEQILACAPFEIATDKIYYQTPGPRFETKAEVRALRLMGADVVGMTLANEADLLQEKGISITAFCMIDNYAHGIGGQTLSESAFHQLVKANQEKVDAFLGAVIGGLG